MCRLLALLCLTAVFSTFAAQEKPNIVLIFADDLGYGDLSCYGATKLQTPHIDQLASEGRRFTDAHSASAVCSPSRYALLTGAYPFRNKMAGPIMYNGGLSIKPNQQTIGSLLQDEGYSTACIGKWHLGFGKNKPNWNGDLKPGPLEVGFDYYYGVPVVNSHPPFVYVENHRVVGLVADDPFVRKKKANTEEHPEKMGLTAIGGADAAHELYKDNFVGTHLTEKVVTWIKEKHQDPFFLFFSTTNIHHPFTPHPQFQGTSECGPYGDFVHELDWMVGQVMTTLKETGVADNTLVIFTSDNGGMFNVGGQNAWDDGHRMNGDLLGYKFSAWEGGHRVPFITHWPGKIPAGTVSDQLLCNVDMLATFAALLGTKPQPDQAPDSYNLLETFIGEPAQPLRDHLLLGPKQQSHLTMRQGRWVYIGAQAGGGFTQAKRGAHGFGGPPAITYSGRPNSDIENGKIRADAPPAQLYDLEADLGQANNRYHDHPEVVDRMKALLQRTLESERTAP